MFYVYVLLSEEEKPSYYIGFSSDVEKRVADHNAGRNRSTAGKRWKLAYYEAYVSEESARRREQKLKRNPRMRQFLLNRVLEQFR